jgi:hypothetical protein
MNKLIEEHNRHVGEEGENLKKLLEGDWYEKRNKIWQRNKC